MRPESVACIAALLLFSYFAKAQSIDPALFQPKNTYSAFVEYANDSSHILLGSSPNRKFAGLGFQFERRLVANHALTLRYAAEFRPLILESDPVSTVTVTDLSPPPTYTFVEQPQAAFLCKAGLQTLSSTDPATGVVYVQTQLTACTRRWTYAQGLSPLGIRINLRPHHRLQPTASLLTGYMLSAKKIPLDDAGSFNFTFEVGLGLELYQSPSRSIRLEYQIQHFSNAYTAQTNYGVDNGLFKLTYNFGK